MNINNLNKERVLVGMSGGVDSSAAAALLIEQGYEVVGITITSVKLEDNCVPDTRESGCCNYQAIMDAMDVCSQLGIVHHLIDLSDIFKEKVISNFISEYLDGRTPNPCTLCNPLIKWGEVLKKADLYDCYYYATGHYSKVYYNEETKRYVLKKGVDNLKDQSYFLWGLTQEHLSRTIFPLGDMNKKQTREIAKKFEIPVYNKIESQEICFVTSNDYTQFLKVNVPEIESKFDGGDIVFDGIVIGKHKGYPFYTIGQRKGLGVSYHQPLFVKDIIPENNTVVVGTIDNIQNTGFIAENINLMKYTEVDENKIFEIKIRYRDKGSMGYCKIDNNGNLIVNLLHPKNAITPGQSVVIYEDDDVVAGGVIKEVF